MYVKVYRTERLNYAEYDLIHSNMVSLKRDRGKQRRPRSAFDQSLLCLHSMKKFLQNTIIMKINQTLLIPDTPYIRNEPVQRVLVEESTKHNGLIVCHNAPFLFPGEQCDCCGRS